MLLLLCVLRTHAGELSKIHLSPNGKVAVTCLPLNWLHAAGWNLENTDTLKQYDRAISVTYQNRAAWIGATSEGEFSVAWSPDSTFGVLLDAPKSSPALSGISILEGHCFVNAISIEQLLQIGRKKFPQGQGSLPHDDIQNLIAKNGHIEGVYIRSKYPQKWIVPFQIAPAKGPNKLMEIKIQSEGHLLPWTAKVEGQ